MAALCASGRLWHARAMLYRVFLVLCLLAPASNALAVDGTDLRFGLGVGLMGSQPLGGDVGQDGAPDEFSQALWMHLDLFTLDIGEHWSVGAFGRLSFSGGIDPDGVKAGLNENAPVLCTEGEVSPIDPTQPCPAGGLRAGPATASLTQWGITGRYFLLGDGFFRPFLSLGAALVVSRTKYETRRDLGGGGFTGFGGGTPRAGQIRERTHRGISLLAGVGVRFDIKVPAFGETALLPLAVEVQYSRNQWLDLRRVDLYESDPDRQLSPEGMQLDYLVLALTVGYLR